jgi:hypothetical protein
MLARLQTACKQPVTLGPLRAGGFTFPPISPEDECLTLRCARRTTVSIIGRVGRLARVLELSP